MVLWYGERYLTALQEKSDLNWWGIIGGRNAMISQDLYRIDSDSSKRKVFCNSAKWVLHVAGPYPHGLVQ